MKDKSSIKKRNEEVLSVPKKYKLEIVWFNVIFAAYFHILSIFGLYDLILVAQWKTVIFTIISIIVAIQGLTVGAHRLWSHNSFKAKLPLKIILATMQTFSFQDSIYQWARDHRVHHKFTETDADPHNSTRGFFFSHIGWVLVKKHKDVLEQGKKIDLSDLKADPIVMFQRRHYFKLAAMIAFVIPTLIPWYFWNENLKTSFVAVVVRYLTAAHITLMINSGAHYFMWGYKPYDKNIRPVDFKMMNTLTIGEAMHNYHHTFPWDYRGSEFPTYGVNGSLALIDLMAKIGWAYDMKSPSPEMIEKRARRTGDGTRTSKVKIDENWNNSKFDYGNYKDDEHIWGWGDEDFKDKGLVEIKKKEYIS